MTLVAAWIRRTPGGKELIVASDSRVSGGITLDHAPKIFRLERNDAVLAYCGSTLVAYPLILQIKAGLDAYEETRNRVIDIVQLKAHIEKIIESLKNTFSYLPNKDDIGTNFKILLAGYSWKVNDFRVWTFRFDVKTGEFNAFKMKGGHSFQFMSDRPENERQATSFVLKRFCHYQKGDGTGLNWEPLAALIDMIKDSTIDDIGGAPQIVKIYRHSNTMPVNVLWPETKKQNSFNTKAFSVTHLGRSLLDYEHSRYLTLDPETWELVKPWEIRERIESKNQREIEAERERKLLLICGLIKLFSKKKQLQGELTAMISRGCTFSELSAVMSSTHSE